jgi:hypothetical protein
MFTKNNLEVVLSWLRVFYIEKKEYGRWWVKSGLAVVVVLRVRVRVQLQ